MYWTRMPLGFTNVRMFRLFCTLSLMHTRMHTRIHIHTRTHTLLLALSLLLARQALTTHLSNPFENNVIGMVAKMPQTLGQ